MIAHGKDIKIFAGNSNRAPAQEICQHLNTKLGRLGGRQICRW